MSLWSTFTQLFGGTSSDDFFSESNSGPAVNPATGLPMNPDGVLDVAGNIFGTSASDGDFEIGGGCIDFTDNGMFSDSDLF
jgi:hypothetical protein